ncbi:putative membrane protein, partial [Oceanicola granulosus HTCC2516]
MSAFAFDSSRHAGRAIAVMCFGVFCLVLSDTASKWLVERYHPLQIQFVRNLIAAPVVGLIILFSAGPRGLVSA